MYIIIIFYLIVLAEFESIIHQNDAVIIFTETLVHAKNIKHMNALLNC